VRPTVNLRIIVLIVLIMASTPLCAREKIDFIKMKNGDRITCEITRMSSSTIYIKVDYILDTISLDWAKVASIESTQLFIVRALDGSVYTGSISARKGADDAAIQVQITDRNSNSATIEGASVVEIRQTESAAWERLSGRFGAGFTFSKGNDTAQYNLNSNINYTEERWTVLSSFASNWSTSTGARTSTRNEIDLQVQRPMQDSNWYYAALADFLQSSVQGLNLQTTLGGDIGRVFRPNAATSFAFYGGIVWQQINYKQSPDPAAAQSIASGIFGARAELFQFDKTSLLATVNVLPAISDPGRVHATLNLSYYVKLWGKLNWDFSAYANHDNRPPAGFAASDYGTSTGISITFGSL
jgi:hypothetical protein